MIYILKGSFDKCDICHNADNLLSSANNWSEAEVEIIQGYRRQHITQQFDERIKLQQNINDTFSLDHNGQPVKALLFGDGMTVYTGLPLFIVSPAVIFISHLPLFYEYDLFAGNTPRQKVENRGSKGNTHVISSRVIGVEVHCGPIHGTILYYTDDLSKGGSSTIVEITRQGVILHCVIMLLSIYV